MKTNGNNLKSYSSELILFLVQDFHEMINLTHLTRSVCKGWIENAQLFSRPSPFSSKFWFLELRSQESSKDISENKTAINRAPHLNYHHTW